MKIIHVSDIHFTAPCVPMGGLDPHARFDRALADIVETHADAERIVITGDLTHWGERAAYEALAERLESLPVPVRLMIGNHDDRDTFLAVFPDHPKDANGFVNHAETLGGTRFIYLDTVGARSHAGHFCAARRDWLRAELEQAGRARIFLHHNPMLIGLPAEDKIALVPQDRAPLHDLLSEFADRIEYLHFGHVHAPIHGRFRGIPFASIPSTGNQCIPDFHEPDLLKSAAMAPAYFVLLIEGEDTIIHQVPFAWDGPVTTSGSEWEDWAKTAPGAG